MEPRMEHILHKALPRITQTISGPLYTVIFGHTSTIAIRYCPENMQNMYTMAILNYVDQAPSVRDLSRGLRCLPLCHSLLTLPLSFCPSLSHATQVVGPSSVVLCQEDQEVLGNQRLSISDRRGERVTVCVLIGRR